MKKFLFAAAAFAALTPIAGSFAATFKVPSDKPAASITFPDTWKPHEIDNGVEAQSPDEAVYIAVEATNAKELDGKVAESIKWLQEKGVVIDAASQKQTDFKVNDMNAREILWQGKDKDGPTVCSVTFVQTGPTLALLFTYWATPDKVAKNKAAIDKILNSIKKAS